MNANPAINSQTYAYGAAMNQGPFMQQVPPGPQSLQSFNPASYTTSTPQPQGQFPFQHPPQPPGGYAGPHNYGVSQARGMLTFFLLSVPSTFVVMLLVLGQKNLC